LHPQERLAALQRYRRICHFGLVLAGHKWNKRCLFRRFASARIQPVLHKPVLNKPMLTPHNLDLPIVVQKYGGSSVADAGRLRHVAERIVATRESGKHVVVVVSAMASTTDDLLSKAHGVASSPSRRELDMLLSCGERASMALLTMAVHALGHQAISLTGSQSGIMTNDRHSGARIIEVRPIRVADELSRGNIVIVAGFQGVSYKREITTLGRGGSDTTAVALAGALGAEYCEICSDVDGIYTADPRLVSAAELLSAIRTDEMLELAAHGAKVLHASCVQIAAANDIQLYARATDKEGGGTRIDRLGGRPRTKPVGVTGHRPLVRLRAASLEPLLQAAAQHSLPLLHVATGESHASLWFGLADVPDWSAIRATLRESTIEISEGLAAVSIVGAGLGSDAAFVQRVLQLAAELDVAVLETSTSPLRVSLFCQQQWEEGLVVHLHRALVEEVI
jgi:aspartate kinase